MYKIAARFIGALVMVIATLGMTAVTANAQASVERPARAQVAKDCSLPSWYISGSNVRIRNYYGDVVLGFAQYGERIDITYRYGTRVEVWFKNRSASQVRKGWVHQDYTDYRNPPPCR